MDRQIRREFGLGNRHDVFHAMVHFAQKFSRYHPTLVRRAVPHRVDDVKSELAICITEDLSASFWPGTLPGGRERW